LLTIAETASKLYRQHETICALTGTALPIIVTRDYRSGFERIEKTLWL
jgi:hypothetical protein